MEAITTTIINEESNLTDMKVVGIIGVLLGVVGLLVGVYCQLGIIPKFNALDLQYDLNEIDRALWRTLADQKFILGSIALFLGALASIIGLFTKLKKQKIGWIALGIGLASFLLGALQSTHMFS